MAEFKPGDLVYLKQPLDGPPLTVAEMITGGDVRCRWWGRDGALHEHVFHVSELIAEDGLDEEKTARAEAKKAARADKKAAQPAAEAKSAVADAEKKHVETAAAKHGDRK